MAGYDSSASVIYHVQNKLLAYSWSGKPGELRFPSAAVNVKGPSGKHSVNYTNLAQIFYLKSGGANAFIKYFSYC